MTEVILPALDAQDRDLLVQHLFYQRYLLVEDLILKIQGCSRDNNLPAGQDRRNQVGQGLAGRYVEQQRLLGFAPTLRSTGVSAWVLMMVR